MKAKIKVITAPTTNKLPEISTDDRKTYKRWLESADTHELGTKWEAIEKNWQDFRRMTSPLIRSSRPTADRYQHLVIEQAILELASGSGAASAKWPEADWNILHQDSTQEAVKLTEGSLQNIWGEMICFLAYSSSKGRLDVMGLGLEEDQRQSLEKIHEHSGKEPVEPTKVQEAIRNLVEKAFSHRSATVTNNVMLWWIWMLDQLMTMKEEKEQAAKQDSGKNIVIIIDDEDDKDQRVHF